MSAIEETPCPACSELALRIEWRLTARPLGTYSLAGHQLKVSAREVPWLVCGSCGVEAQGKAEPAEAPARHPTIG